MIKKKMLASERICFWLNLKYFITAYIVNYMSNKTTVSTCRQL